MEEKKYFHELSKEEISELQKKKVGWGYIRDNFKQPKWCSYPDALDFERGCWTLTELYHGISKIRCELDCAKCECYRPSKK